MEVITRGIGAQIIWVYPLYFGEGCTSLFDGKIKYVQGIFSIILRFAELLYHNFELLAACQVIS